MNRSYYKYEGKEKVGFYHVEILTHKEIFSVQVTLTQQEEEKLGIGNLQWSLRATVTPSSTDYRKTALHIGVLPVAKTRIQQTIDAWKLGIQQEDIMVPTLGTMVSEKGMEESLLSSRPDQSWIVFFR